MMSRFLLSSVCFHSDSLCSLATAPTLQDLVDMLATVFVCGLLIVELLFEVFNVLLQCCRLG